VRAVRDARAGDYDAASWALTQAHAADPATERITADVERWLDEVRNEEANRTKRLAELDARIHDLQREKAFAYLREGDTTAFETTARKILERDPREANIRAELATVMLNQNRNREAQDELVKALEVDPRNPAWLINLGVAAARLDDLDAAEGITSEAVMVDATNEIARRNRDNLASQTMSTERDVARVEKVKKAVDESTVWRAEVKAKLEKLALPASGMIEGSYSELKPGDVVLLEPNDFKSQLIAVADQLYTGRILSWNVEAPASHAVTYLGQDARGRALYLNNTMGRGPHVIGQTEYEQEYGARPGYVARPQDVVNGRDLLEAALEAVHANEGRVLDTGYGLIGKKDGVCSEAAGIAVVKATNGTSGAGVFGHLGPIDITPGDFFDTEHIGKYFVVTRLRR
jgi:Flp pilus assembly protein TadD